MSNDAHIGIVLRCLNNKIGRTVASFNAREFGDATTPVQGWVVRYLYENRDKDVFQKDLEIAFNCKYLLNCVRAADADGLLLTLKSPTQSITMEPLVKNPDDDFFYLVQPVRMHE